MVTQKSGRCSVCKRPFHVPGERNDIRQVEIAFELDKQFREHNCKEDASQAAARIVREATKDH